MTCAVIEKRIQTVRKLLSPFTWPNFKLMKQERDKVISNMLLCLAYSSIINMEGVYFSETSINLPHILDRAIAQAVRRRLPTTGARVPVRSKLCGSCGGQCGTKEVSLRVFRFPLPILIPPAVPSSSPSIILDWNNRPVSGRRTK
jgi:hypothetical protein